jgi:hypothetical protein
LVGFGIGEKTSSVTVRGAPILELDRNAEGQRVISAAVTRREDGGPEVRLASNFDFQLGTHFKEVAGSNWGVDPSSAGWDETYHLTLTDEAGAPAVALIKGKVSGWSALQGTLTLSSSTAGDAVMLEGAGECLYRRARAGSGDGAGHVQQLYVTDVCR